MAGLDPAICRRTSLDRVMAGSGHGHDVAADHHDVGIANLAPMESGQTMTDRERLNPRDFGSHEAGPATRDDAILPPKTTSWPRPRMMIRTLIDRLFRNFVLLVPW